MLTILTTTYSEKVPVMVWSNIIDSVMGMITQGELTVTLKQAHFGAVMSGSLQLSCTELKGNREVGKESLPPQALTLQHPGSSAWMMSGDLSTPLRRITIPQFGTISIHGNTGVL